MTPPTDRWADTVIVWAVIVGLFVLGFASGYAFRILEAG